MAQKENIFKNQSGRVGSFLSVVIILPLKIPTVAAEIICKYPTHGALARWHSISKETAVTFLGLNVVKSEGGGGWDMIKKV